MELAELVMSQLSEQGIVILWLPFCLFWFKQISVEQAQLK
jgi:hypothetical protein